MPDAGLERVTRGVVGAAGSLLLPVLVGGLTAWIILAWPSRVPLVAGAGAVFLVFGIMHPRVVLWTWLLLAPLGERYGQLSLPIGLPDVTFTRGVIGVVALALLLRVALRVESLKPVRRVGAPALALAAVMGADLAWRGQDIPSELLQHLDELGVPVLLYVFARQYLGRPADLWRTAWTLTIVGLYLGAMGASQFLEFTAVDSQVSMVAIERVGGSRVNENFLAQGRSTGPFSSPLEFGAVGTYAFAAALLVTSRFRGLLARGVAVTALGLSAAAVVFSATRSVWPGPVVAALLIAGLDRQRRWVSVAATVAVLVLGGAVFLALPGREVVADRALVTTSVYSRLATYRIGWELAVRRPLTGHGTGEATLRAAQAEAIRLGALSEGASGEFHNTFLSMLVQWGVAGPITYIAVLTALLGIVFEARRQARARQPELVAFTGFVLACWTILLLQHLVVSTTPFHFLNGVSFLLVGITHAQLDGLSEHGPENAG